MSLVTITDDNFEKEVLKPDIPVIIDFWAEWFSPCRLIAPIMDELAEEFNGKIKVGKLDVDSNQQTAIKYGVRSIPTVLMLKDGEVKEVVIGAVPKAMFVDKINSLL